MTRDFVLSAAQRWTVLAIYLLTALNSPSLDLKLTSLHFQPYNSYHIISENLALTRNPLVGIFFLYIIFALKFSVALGGTPFYRSFEIVKKDSREQGESQTVLLAVTNDWTNRDSFPTVDLTQLMSGTWQSYTRSHRMSPHRSHLRVYVPHDKQDKFASFH